MDTKLPFIVFGPEWGLHPTSTQHLVFRLALTNPVLYVNAIGLRPPILCAYDARRAWDKLRQWISPSGKVPATGLAKGYLYSPVTFPFNAFGPIRCWNRRMLVRGLHHQMQMYGFDSPILFVSSPIGGEVVGGVGERLLVYYITDQYAEWPRGQRDYIGGLERTLLDQADLILVTSIALQREKKGRKTGPILLPHGVDFSHFHSAAEPLGPMPEELQRLPRPVLGFFGLLAPWLDFDLLEHLAWAFPKASVVLIGPRWGDCEVPRSVPNLHWLGPRSYNDLPRYAAHFDVGLIPFQQNRLTSYANPLKLLEYLALGLPVVSTPLPDLSCLTDVVAQACNPSEFVYKVELALADRAPERRQYRFSLAAEESWEARVATLWRYIEDALQVQRVS